MKAARAWESAALVCGGVNGEGRVCLHTFARRSFVAAGEELPEPEPCPKCGSENVVLMCRDGLGRLQVIRRDE